MKNFKAVLSALVAAFFVCGCADSIFPSTCVREERPPLERNVPGVNPAPDILFCGVEYDSTYEWRSDSAWVDEPYAVVMFRNGVPAVRRDRAKLHRLDSWGLWCDEGGCVTLNGSAAFDKAPDESLSDACYPWAATFSSGTWRLRRSGVPALEGLGTLGPLYKDAYQVCCLCTETVAGARERSIVADGERKVLPGRESVLDARLVGGNLWVLRIQGRLCMLEGPSGTRTLTLPGGGRILEGRIHDGLSLEFTLLETTGTFTTALALPDGSWTKVQSDGFVHVLDASGSYVRCSKDGIVDGVKGGRPFVVDRPVRFFSDRCICLTSDGRLILALTPKDGGEPFLWTDGAEVPVHICGYLTGVCQAE